MGAFSYEFLFEATVVSSYATVEKWTNLTDGGY